MRSSTKEPGVTSAVLVCFFDWFAEAPASEPWDLAISYASEDEPVAREIKKRLGDEFRVFFAPDEEAWMWGEDLDRVLPKLYGVECRYVLVLSTEAYCAKHWTRVEFEAARTRTGRLLVVNLGKLPDDMPRDVLYREGSPAGLVGLLDDLRMRLERLLNARASCAICASATQREDAQGARFWNDV